MYKDKTYPSTQYLGMPMLKNEVTLYEPLLWLKDFLKYDPKAVLLYLGLISFSFYLPIFFPKFMSTADGVLINLILSYGGFFGGLFYSTTVKIKGNR